MQPPSGTAPPPTYTVRARGQDVPLWPAVRPWTETGLGFPGLAMRDATKLICLHWTGAENSPAQLHANLVREGLSVHFAIDQLGVIWQFADTDALCAHAKGANERAIGIEIINRGSNLTAPDKGVRRAQLTETIHGVKVTYAAFTPQQTEAAILLVTALCRAYKLPMRVPMLGSDVYASELPPAVKNAFTGVIGHLQWSQGRKLDPGLSLLRLVHARGAALPVG
jgi:N-acetyl-anhydromuramyl-L-alanine amidase AmpD